MLLNNKKSITVKAYYYSIIVGIANVSWSEKKKYIDLYYCLASIKVSKSFINIFSNLIVMISQNDKVKVNVSISTIEHTVCFKSYNQLLNLWK